LIFGVGMYFKLVMRRPRMKLFPTFFAIVFLFSGHVYSQQNGLSKEFSAFIAQAEAAQVKLQRGDASEYKAMWSHTDNVTLSGGFGGNIEAGWANVSKRLDWAATQYTNGTNTIERIAASDDGRIGYLVQIERVKFKVPATGADAIRDYRVTMIFRREKGKWVIVHRHADSQTTKQPV